MVALSSKRILDMMPGIVTGHPIANYETLDLDRRGPPFGIGEVKLALADHMEAARRLIVRSFAIAVSGNLHVNTWTGEPTLSIVDSIAAVVPRGLPKREAFGAVGTAPV